MSFGLLFLSLFALSIADDPFEGPTYQHQSRFAKRDQLFQNILASTVPGSFPNIVQAGELFVESMSPTMNYTGDHFPNQYIGKLFERKKLIHSVGVHALATFNITSNPRGYTGLFASGSDAALIRFSTATAPVKNNPVTQGSYVPGIGMKFLRDNTTAANIFAMYALAGQENYNFFAHDLTNHVPSLGSWAPAPLQALAGKFRSVSKWPTMIGLNTMARFDKYGKEYPNPRFPYRLIFHPATKYHVGFPSGWTDVPYWEQLASGLDKGLVFYVYAQDQPLQDNSKLFKIGEVHLSSSAITSQFGDKHLFLQHTAFETDLDVVPSWAGPAAEDVKRQEAVSGFPGFVYPDLPFN